MTKQTKETIKAIIVYILSMSITLIVASWALSYLINKQLVPQLTQPTATCSTDPYLFEDKDSTVGVASWYDYDLKDYPDYSKDHLTCASRDYPKGTMLEVTYGDKSVVCRVNDWIEHPDRIIDLSSMAFKELAPLSVGLLEVIIK